MPTPGLGASGTARLVGIYGEGYTMEDVCKGCMQRHRCASCLDGSRDEYVPPSYLTALAKRQGERIGKDLAKDPGCTVLRDGEGRVIGFMCGRGRQMRYGHSCPLLLAMLARHRRRAVRLNALRERAYWPSITWVMWRLGIEQMRSTPWVVMDCKTGEAVCQHCGERRRPPLPMAITAFVRWSDAFRGLHVDCLPGKVDPAELRDVAAKTP